MRSGAGRPAWKPKTSQLRHIDVRRLHRDNLLGAGLSYGWQWKDDAGNVKASIDVRTDHGGLTFSYTTNGENVAQRIGITTTPCTYGGGRPWFVCPHCHKRRALLYLARQVACRTCFRMTYPSQCEDVVGRLWRTQRKIEARLHSGKRMQRRTRERLAAELERIEDAKNTMLAVQMARMFGHGVAAKLW
ncbi:hypothetical protein LJR296_002956 [Cupriavidus necator]|uniref:hypothetical protein n=1 Tax=Cupriavidus necator TaxID=106590 RepID=UPI003ED011D9